MLDADERGKVLITIANGGAAPLTGADVTLSSTSAGVLFPSGPISHIATLAPYETYFLMMSGEDGPGRLIRAMFTA